MFSSLSARMNIAFFQMTIYAAKAVVALPHLQLLAVGVPRVLGSVTAVTPTLNCGDDIMSVLITGINRLVGILAGLGIAAGVVGIAVGGLMRATSFGNERRIAMSNTAITCAVVGLVIVILALTVGNDIPTWLGMGNSSCSLNNNATPEQPAVPANGG